jgi:hypothetical protein
VALDEVNPVGVDDTVVSASDSEVVGYQNDRSFGWCCHTGLFWAATELWSSTSLISTASEVLSISPLVVSVVSGLHCNLVNGVLKCMYGDPTSQYNLDNIPTF